MTIEEVLQQAKEAGFKQLNDGARTWELDNFAAAMQGDKGEYTLNFNGNIHRYTEDGYIESAPCFTLRKEE